jgi:hypothetical protein
MDPIPRPGDPAWAMSQPPAGLATRIIAVAGSEPPAVPSLSLAVWLTLALAACGLALALATGLWAPLLIAAGQVAGLASAWSAVSSGLLAWPVAAGAAMLVAVEMAVLTR